MKQSNTLAVILGLVILAESSIGNTGNSLSVNSYAQQPISTEFKIVFPLNYERFLVGNNVTIYGVAPYNNTNHNCTVSVSNARGMIHHAIAAGNDGQYDYSTWVVIIHDLNVGINVVTATYSCHDNPSSVSFDTVNIIGTATKNISQGTDCCERHTKQNADGGSDIGNPGMIHSVIPGGILPAQLILQYLYWKP